jgi:hypothetical protein
MTRYRCQICGSTATDADGRIPWMISGDEWKLLTAPANPKWVTTPPTCRSCWPTAIRHCPHLRSNGAVPVSVAAATPAAAYGEIYQRGQFTPHQSNIAIPLSARRDLPCLLGKQLVVDLHDIRPETQGHPVTTQADQVAKHLP